MAFICIVSTDELTYIGLTSEAEAQCSSAHSHSPHLANPCYKYSQIPCTDIQASQVKMAKPTSKESTLTMFELLKPSAAATEAGVARLGRLAFASNRRIMQTPNYIAVASRGVVPHLTPDNVAKHTTFDAAYLAIEDCMNMKSIFEC